MAWQHDHRDCERHIPAPKKAYDMTIARRTIHEFKTQKYVDSVRGTEMQAEARCIELNRQQGGRADFFYRTDA